MEKEKSRLAEDIQVITPSEDIACRECKFRLSGVIGYKNRYCSKYTRENGGKPLGILYEKAECEYWERG